MAGEPRQQTVKTYNDGMTKVEAKVTKSTKFVNIWVIFAKVTIAMGAADTLSKDNKATFFAAGPNWPKKFGGGNKLGPIDRGAVPGLTYAYTVGKIEARAVLKPAGIGDIIDKTKWKFIRSGTSRAWDNGGKYVGDTWQAGFAEDSPVDTDDTSNPPQLDLDPSSKNHLDKIYDVDAPGCPISIDPPKRTAEVYMNFYQRVTVDLGAGDVRCSLWDDGKWSYQAQIDMDKKGANKVDSNVLSSTFVTIPATPKYAKR